MKIFALFVCAATFAWPYTAQAYRVVVDGAFKSVVIETGPAGVVCEACSYTFAGDELRISTPSSTTVSASEGANVVVSGSGAHVVANTYGGAGVNSVAVAHGDGARASVSINGNVVNSNTSGPPSAVARVTLPSVRSLAVSGVVETLSVAPAVEALNMRGVIQSATASDVRDLSVSFTGGGTARVGRATGQANVSLTGGGEVRIESASLQVLNARVVGGGDLQIGGRVATARLQCIGSGRISVDHIDYIAARGVIGACDVTRN